MSKKLPLGERKVTYAFRLSLKAKVKLKEEAYKAHLTEGKFLTLLLEGL